jgi:translation initiation factor 1A
MHPKRRNGVARDREMSFAEDGQFYAQVTKMLGGCRLAAKTLEGAEVQCKIRGSMQKRVYLHVGDWILACDRDLAGSTADVIDKYTPAEVQYLRRVGEITMVAAVDDADEFIEFAENSDEDAIDAI